MVRFLSFFSIFCFFQKTNEQIPLYYLPTYFRSFFGRKWRHLKDILKLTDLYSSNSKFRSNTIDFNSNCTLNFSSNCQFDNRKWWEKESRTVRNKFKRQAAAVFYVQYCLPFLHLTLSIIFPFTNLCFYFNSNPFKI